VHERKICSCEVIDARNAGLFTDKTWKLHRDAVMCRFTMLLINAYWFTSVQSHHSLEIRGAMMYFIGTVNAQSSLKTRTHYPCSRAVNTAREHRCHFWTTAKHGPSRSAVLTLLLFSTCMTGVQNDTRVHGREHGSRTRPVNTGSVYRP